jgi:hypothetical protein
MLMKSLHLLVICASYLRRAIEAFIPRMRRATAIAWSLVVGWGFVSTNFVVTVNAVPNARLVAAYSFNEGSGTGVTDVSGNGNNGTTGNATWTTSGKYGNALTFNGTSARVTVNDAASLRLTGGMTLEAWVYPTTVNTATRDVIYKGDDNYYLEGSSFAGHKAPAMGGTLGSPLYGPGALSANTWAHLAATYDGATMRLYVNGAQVASRAQTGAIATSANPLQIGGDSIYGQYFAGRIDEVRIYNRALSQTEIQADMSSAIGTPTTPTPSPTPTSTATATATPTATATATPTATATGLSIYPRVAALTFTQTQQFTASGGSVTWSVDGVVGGSSASGTITSAGLYSPPASVGTHTITVSDQITSASATVYITDYPGTFTHHNDNLRTGQNLDESVLTPANVNSATFGKLFSYQLDGISFASPLYMANVNVPGQGFHNLVFVATEHDSVYALDADGVSAAPIWHVSFIDPAAGITPVPPADTGETGDIPNEIGITGTPVIDPTTGTLYVVAKTKEVVGGSATYRQRLHALDITTGAERFGGPVAIQASVHGDGVGSQGHRVNFDPLPQNQRPALLLNSGVVYVGFGVHGNPNVYHGWVIGYAASTLQQVMVYNTTPDARAGGVWQGGGGMATDAAGNIYFATGNGTFDANSGGSDYGDSVVQLRPNGNVLDYFSPHDQLNLDINDVDLGSGGVLLLPDQNGPNPHLIISAGKGGTIYLISRDNMGHFMANFDTQIVQELPNVFPGGTLETGNRINPIYFDGSVYFCAGADHITVFQLNNGLLSIGPTSQSPEVFEYPGGPLAISATGSTNAILWSVQRFGLDPSGGGVVAPGVLRAYDPANLATEFYNSDQAGLRDTLDFAAKFNVPLVANGKVFVASENQLTIYGLLP